MLLSNPDIEITVRMLFLKANQATALPHRRGDRHQPGVRDGLVTQPLAEYLRIRRPAARSFLLHADFRIEGRHRVIAHGVSFCRLVAHSLLGDDMQQARAGLVAHLLYDLQQPQHVMAADRPKILHAQFLEQHACRQDHSLELPLHPHREFLDSRHRAQHALACFTHRGVQAPCQQAGQVTGHGAHIRGDRHLVVVEDHQHIRLGDPQMIERFVGQAGGQPAVPDHGHRLARFPCIAAGQRHAQGRADRGAGVSHPETVVRALMPFRERRKAPPAANRLQLVAAPRQDLVPITLVPHVPDQPVFRRVERVVQGHGQFDRTEAGPEVPPAAGHALNQEFAKLICNRREILAVQRAQISRAFNLR